jgi:hypothetical protein
MTTNNAVSDQHSVVIQNTANGQVDFLRFSGGGLQSSVLRDYGLSGWTIVGNGDLNGDGNADLIAQNNSTGQLDFLFLNATGNLVGSATSNVPVPHAVGLGEFNGPTPNVVTQLANGQLDILSFNYTTGQLTASDLIANTVGLPTAVGVGESFQSWPVFANVGTAGNDSVIVEYPDGTVDSIGFSGSITSGLTFTSSFARGPINAQVFAVDQDNDFAHQRDANIFEPATNRETFDVVGVNNAGNPGRVEIHSWVSGYSDLSHEGVSLGVINTNFTLSAGWQVVDAGIVAHTEILPLA